MAPSLSWISWSVTWDGQSRHRTTRGSKRDSYPPEGGAALSPRGPRLRGRRGGVAVKDAGRARTRKGRGIFHKSVNCLSTGH